MRNLKPHRVDWGQIDRFLASAEKKLASAHKILAFDEETWLLNPESWLLSCATIARLDSKSIFGGKGDSSLHSRGDGQHLD